MTDSKNVSKAVLIPAKTEAERKAWSDGYNEAMGKIKGGSVERWIETYNMAVGGLLANPNHDPMGACHCAEQVADKSAEIFKRRFHAG